jgi:hypothetical protein
VNGKIVAEKSTIGGFPTEDEVVRAVGAALGQQRAQ